MYDIFEQLLQKHGVTTYKVSKETGISQTTFSNWKSGRSIPKQDKLQLIANYFGVSVDYLMGRDETFLENGQDDNNIELIINEFPMQALTILSKLCKNERIVKDYTENFVSKSIEVPLQDYLKFENEHWNIGSKNIVKILKFYELNLPYIFGFLSGSLLSSISSTDNLSSLYDKFSIPYNVREMLQLIDNLDNDDLKELMNHPAFKNYVNNNLHDKLKDAYREVDTDQKSNLNYIDNSIMLNAAHEIPEATEDQKKHDDDIMNDDNF